MYLLQSCNGQTLSRGTAAKQQRAGRAASYKLRSKQRSWSWSQMQIGACQVRSAHKSQLNTDVHTYNVS